MQLQLIVGDNMGDTSTARKRFGLTRRQFNFCAGISILWLAFCFSLLLPPIRNLIIRLGEIIAHRPINNPFWHEMFISISIIGTILYVIIFGLFLSSFVSQIIANRISNILAITISLIFGFIIMYKANWTFSDEHLFLSTTAVNKYINLRDFGTGNGRFTPFMVIHYNLLLFVFRCLGINTGLPVEAHFTVIAIFFLVTFFSLFFLFNRIGPIKTAGTYSVFNCFFACTFFLLGSSFSSSFLTPTSHEAIVIMSFAVFMLMYYQALKTDKIKYYTAAFLSAVYSTYVKEPVFGVFLVIAFVNYLFRYNKISKREKIFYIALIANGVLFLILYYFLSFKKVSGFYNQGRVSVSGFEFLLSIIQGNPVLIILLCFGLIRLYSVIVRKERDCLFHDSLLFAGIAYVFAFFILHLNYNYYFLPSIILFLPSLVHWMKYFLEKKRTFAVALFIILLPLYLYNFGYTVAGVRETWRQRQELMPYITNLLSDYNNGKEFIWYESDNRVTDNTFYVATRNWRKHVENTFLNYLNKSEGINFFVAEHNMDHITMDYNILFFYPVDNDQWQPMRDELAKILQDNNFALYKDSYGVLIYKQY
jgi:hypothetical protein